MFLSEVIRNFDAQLSQEQTWAICHATMKQVLTKRRENMIKRRSVRFVVEAETVQLTKNGGVEIMAKEETQRKQSESEIMQSIGKVLLRCLDKSDDVSQLRRTNYEPDLIELISGLVDRKFDEHDEGYEGDSAYDVTLRQESNGLRQFRNLDEICRFCDDRIRRKNIASGSKHYQNVVKALYYEAYELKLFLDHVTSSLNLASEASEARNMDPSVANTAQECVYEWARFWLQVMQELRRGVHLRKVSQTKISPEEYELLPRELVFDNEVSTIVTSKPDGKGRLPENAGEIIMDFILSNPPENQRMKFLPYEEDVNDFEEVEDKMAEMDIASSVNGATSNIDRRKSLKVESPLWDKVHNWDASLESLLSDDKNLNPDHKDSPRSLLDETGGFGSRRNSVDLGQKSPRRVPGATQRRLSADFVYNDTNHPNIDGDDFDFENTLDSNGNTAHVPKKRLAVSTLCLTEVNLEEDHRTVGASLYEISKTRKAISKAEVESLPRNDSKAKGIRSGTVCFGCRSSKFSFFSKAHQCYVCSNKFCSKCIVENVEIPNHLVDTKSPKESPPGMAASHGLSKSLTDLVTDVGQEAITPFPCKRHSLLQLGAKRTYGGKVTSMCQDCKSFIESIITETKNLRWHVGMTIDI